MNVIRYLMVQFVYIFSKVYYIINNNLTRPHIMRDIILYII